MSDELDILKKEVQSYYDTLGKIYCPYFNYFVSFDSKGFGHLFFKGDLKGRPRDDKDILVRLKLVKQGVKIIRISTTLQDFYFNFQWIHFKRYKSEEKILQKVSYWAFIAVLDSKKIKVIVRQVGEGQKHFWSVIPNWKKKKPANSL